MFVPTRRLVIPDFKTSNARKVDVQSQYNLSNQTENISYRGAPVFMVSLSMRGP